jgi:hypothetical protein
VPTESARPNGAADQEVLANEFSAFPNTDAQDKLREASWKNGMRSIWVHGLTELIEHERVPAKAVRSQADRHGVAGVGRFRRRTADGGSRRLS